MVKLGQLKTVSLREIWSNEASDFTPWLLAHPEYLSEALGIDVELVAEEDAETVVCSGLWNEQTESPQDYEELFTRLQRRGLPPCCHKC